MSSDEAGDADHAAASATEVFVLRTYRSKRHFDVTSEPRGARGRKGGDSFVIQKHAARRLHYDLRLELDGTMKSWAATRGPSLVPGEKRLAVHVEDHPIEYNAFEGTIPKGEYGGGTVMIWDRGRWIPEGNPDAGYRKGHLSFRLEGKKLKGAWHLVRMRRKAGDRQEPWLLIKSDDEAARTSGERDILDEKPLSVATGRSLEEIAQGERRHRAGRAKLAASVSTNGGGRAEPCPKRAGRSATGKKGALPGFVPPCLAALKETAPDDSGFVHEIKFDGYRMEGRLDRGKAQLKTRRGLDWTEKFAPIAQALARLPAERALIDGEIVSISASGAASFSQLQQDLKSGRLDRLAYYVFDLLHLDGRDLTGLSLLERKQLLEKLVSRLPADSPIRFSEHFTENGAAMLKHACRMGLEGIVSKRADAPYRSGRGGDWIKTKCSDRQEFVIAGYVLSTADPHAIGALVLGYYDKDRLHYAGRTGTGFSRQTARDLWKRLTPLRTRRPAFPKIPEEERSRDAHWVEPKLVADVSFHGWTHGERVRQAAFQGLREDKPPREVVRERAAAQVNTGRASRSNCGAADVIEGVQLTHPDRIYWQDVGITKRDLAGYYAQIWDWIGPHVVRRPISIVRCPEGSTNECFFQRHVSPGIDADHIHPVRGKDGKPLLAIEDLQGLISLVQAGALEVHVWGTTVDRLDACDRLVFDLDPGPGVDWDEIVDAAREVRERLKGLGLEAFLKTSGGKGLHVVVPIVSTPWSIATPFARGLASAMAGDSPSRYVATLSKKERNGRIFIDYLRNDRTASSIAAYSTRARPGATVSTPVTWTELGRLGGPNNHTILNVPARLARLRRDPWAGIGEMRQQLPASGADVPHKRGRAASGRARGRSPAGNLRQPASRPR